MYIDEEKEHLKIALDMIKPDRADMEVFIQQGMGINDAIRMARAYNMHTLLKQESFVIDPDAAVRAVLHTIIKDIYGID